MMKVVMGLAIGSLIGIYLLSIVVVIQEGIDKLFVKAHKNETEVKNNE